MATKKTKTVTALDTFRSRMKDGYYETAKGAKRAVTRAVHEKNMSADEAKKATAAIKKAFG
jgi:hypothetical protein